MSKKLLALGLSLMMLFTCIVPGVVAEAAPATTLDTAHNFGSAPEGWVDVDDTAFDVLKFFQGDGAGNWNDVTEATIPESTAPTTPAGSSSATAAPAISVTAVPSTSTTPGALLSSPSPVRLLPGSPSSAKCPTTSAALPSTSTVRR